VECGHPLLETLRGLRSHPTYRHVPLERLNQDEVEMALTYLWGRAVPEALIEKIYAQTAGNPFYIEEVAKVLEDDGLIPPSGVSADPMWHEQALKEVRLPQSARETVWKRIEQLSVETRGILRQAAVLGQVFRFEDLQRMSGLSEWQLLERLDEAFERQLIEEIPASTQARGPRLRFRQTEIQDVIYADLGPLRRRLLHRKAGEALEQRAAGKTDNASFGDTFAEELAYHFGEANEIDKTITYSLQAARQAHLTYANATALQWYARALEMLHKIEPENVTRYHECLLFAHQSSGIVLTLTGQYDKALAHFAVAQALLESQPPSDGQRRQVAELCYEIANVYELRDDYDTVFAWLQRGLETVAELAPTVEAARIYLLGSKVYSRQGNNTQALAWCQRSLDIATQITTPEGLRAYGAALYTQAGIDMRLGKLDDAIKFCQESIRAYQEIGDLSGESNAHINLASAYVLRGDWDQASTAYEHGWAIKREIGDIYGQAIGSNNLANLHLKRGEWQEARDMYAQSLAIWQNIRAPRGEAVALINLAQVYIHQEDWAQAQEYLGQSQALFDDIGSKEFLPELERLWGEYYLKTGDVEQAIQHTQQAITLAQTYNDPLEEAIAYRLLGQIHMANAVPQLAAEALSNSLDMLSTLNNEHEIARTKLALARLALTEESASTDQAQTYLREAVETFEKLGARVDLAQAMALQQKTD